MDRVTAFPNAMFQAPPGSNAPVLFALFFFSRVVALFVVLRDAGFAQTMKGCIGIWDKSQARITQIALFHGNFADM